MNSSEVQAVQIFLARVMGRASPVEVTWLNAFFEKWRDSAGSDSDKRDIQLVAEMVNRLLNPASQIEAEAIQAILAAEKMRVESAEKAEALVAQKRAKKGVVVPLPAANGARSDVVPSPVDPQV